MAPAPDEPVWYVAYGSHKVPARLHTYLRGGTPPGSRRNYLGARDPGLPKRSLPLRIPHRLFFAGESPVWGGGVAFVDPRADEAYSTPAVAWLITRSQLSDLIAQENGGEAPGPALGGLPCAGECMVVCSGRYDLAVGLDPIEAVVAVTVTASDPPRPNEPAAAYLALVEAPPPSDSPRFSARVEPDLVEFARGHGWADVDGPTGRTDG